LVDDESDVTTVLTFALEDYGFEVESYNNPLDALSNFKSNYYDLAILDIKMPEMNGFELLREIRKEDENLKICFLTALTELKDHRSDINELSPAFVRDGIIRKPTGNSEYSGYGNRDRLGNISKTIFKICLQVFLRNWPRPLYLKKYHRRTWWQSMGSE